MATTDYANMHKARAAKDDEFYTRMDDVEAEMWYHRESLKGKRVYLNCDDPDASAFARYFRMRFKSLGLKRLVITGLRVGNVKQGVGMEVDANGELPLDTDGDCFSETNRAILAESDVVVTNPPFSLFRDYMDMLMEWGGSFCIIGNLNAAQYKEISPHCIDGTMWFGASGRVNDFDTPRGGGGWISEPVVHQH